MIPDRVPARENPGNAVRYRVAACRRRLREIRANHRTHPDLDVGGECQDLKALPDSTAPGTSLAGPGETETGQKSGIT
jgi:hypothetical protein